MEKAKEMKHVIMIFIAGALLVFGSMVVNFNTIDLIYLCVLAVYMIRYIHIKRTA